jgi:hypothetical protein
MRHQRQDFHSPTLRSSGPVSPEALPGPAQQRTAKLLLLSSELQGISDLRSRWVLGRLAADAHRVGGVARLPMPAASSRPLASSGDGSTPSTSPTSGRVASRRQMGPLGYGDVGQVGGDHGLLLGVGGTDLHGVRRLLDHCRVEPHPLSRSVAWGPLVIRRPPGRPRRCRSRSARCRRAGAGPPRPWSHPRQPGCRLVRCRGATRCWPGRPGHPR